MLTPIQEYGLDFLMHNEGKRGDPSDPGGATMYGISLRWLRAVGELEGDLDGDGDVDADDIWAITPQQARYWYIKYFWLPVYRELPRETAVRVFDMHVNAGPKASHICLQRACRAMGQPVVEDGIIGPATIAAVYTAAGWDDLLACYRSERAGYYRSIAAANPSSRKYLRGWVNRAYS